MRVGGYSLHVYCANAPRSSEDERLKGNRQDCVARWDFMGDYPGVNEADSKRQARADGWRVFRQGDDRIDICRFCVKAGNVPL